MNDRKPDDTSPLAPRRPLSGPGGQPSGTPAAGQHTRPQSSPPRKAPRQSGWAQPPSASRSTADQQTQAMPAVREQTQQPVIPPPPAAAEQTKKSKPPKSRKAPPEQVKSAPKPARSTRRARLNLVRIDPWSVMKLSFALSIAIAMVTVVAVAIVWSVLGAAGVWDAINNSVAIVLENDANGFDVTNYVGLGRVLGLTIVVAAADVVLLTAIATLGAFLYNLAAALLGGLEITLSEDH